jgi:hypothetical protein
VERDKDGKELRYPVILSAKEKEIARLVALAFKVCQIWRLKKFIFYFVFV